MFDKDCLRTDFDRVSWKRVTTGGTPTVGGSLRTDFDRVSWKPSHSFGNRFAGGIVYEPISIGLVGNVSAKTAEGPIAPPVYEPISIGLVGNSGTLLNCLGLFQTRLRTDFDRVSWKPFGDLWSSSPL